MAPRMARQTPCQSFLPGDEMLDVMEHSDDCSPCRSLSQSSLSTSASKSSCSSAREERWARWRQALRIDEAPTSSCCSELLAQASEAWRTQLAVDSPRTFPGLAEFDAAHRQSLERVLLAYATFDPELGYCQGMNFIAGVLLLTSGDEEEAFRGLVQLMGAFGLRGFFTAGFPLLRRYCCAFDELLRLEAPALREHLAAEGVELGLCLHPWLLTLFAGSLPLEAALGFWDLLLAKGLDAALPLALGVLLSREAELLELSFEGLCLSMRTLGREPALDWPQLVREAEALALPASVARLLAADSSPFGWLEAHGSLEDLAPQLDLSQLLRLAEDARSTVRARWQAANDMTATWTHGDATATLTRAANDATTMLTQGDFLWCQARSRVRSDAEAQTLRLGDCRTVQLGSARRLRDPCGALPQLLRA